MILRRAFWWALGAALAAIALQYCLYAVAAIRFPFGLDYSEGLIWQQALWLGGPHLYGDIRQPPFVVCDYPPLYLAVVRGVALSGAGMLVVGRSISVVATLTSCALLGAMVHRACRSFARPRASAAAGVIAGLLPLTLLPVSSWSVLMRVDVLALTLTHAGLLCALLSFRRPLAIYAAVAFFVAAAFAKQNYIAGAIAMFPICVVRSPKHTLLAYAGGALAGIAVIAALQWETEGRFLLHIVDYAADKVDPISALRQIAQWAEAYAIDVGCTLAAVLTVWAGFLRRHRGLRPRRALRLIQHHEEFAWLVFLSLYLLLTSAMLISAGKTGASRNYFLEWMCCWCLWIGWLAGLVIERGAAWRLANLLMPAVLLVQLVPVAAGMRTMQTEQFSQARRADWGALLERVKRIPGPLLSDDMVLTIEAGREVGPEPGILLELARRGVWDERLLTDKLRAHYFGAVITAYDPGDPTFDARYLPATQAAMQAAYPHVEKYGDYRLRLAQ
jgi:hypothetical protein